MEEALYDSLAMRAFAGVDLGDKPAPDETTVCKFRHLLERNNLGTRLFQGGRALSSGAGMKVSSGTIVDATIINAPSSTKNASGERDPEMHQTKKGNQWFFGMKGHFGVDKKTKLIRSVRRAPPTSLLAAHRATQRHLDQLAALGEHAGERGMSPGPGAYHAASLQDRSVNCMCLRSPTASRRAWRWPFT